MTQRYSIAAAKDQLPRLVREAEGGAPIEITRRGRPVAVLLSLAEYQRLAAAQPSLWQGIREFRAEYAVSELDVEHVFEDVRDTDPGREVPL